MAIKNKNLILILSIILIVLIIFITIIKVYKSHVDNMYLAIEKELIEAADKCYLEEKCSDNYTTIKFLLENKYIDKKPIDPKSKEFIEENTKIYHKKGKSTIKIKK